MATATPDEMYGVAVGSEGRILVTFSDHVEVLDTSTGAVQNVPKTTRTACVLFWGNKLRSANRARVDGEGRAHITYNLQIGG
jgi:hypothetical protein